MCAVDRDAHVFRVAWCCDAVRCPVVCMALSDAVRRCVMGHGVWSQAHLESGHLQVPEGYYGAHGG